MFNIFIKKKSFVCYYQFFSLFEDTQRSARLADDKKRTVLLRFYSDFRRAVVPHAMAVQTILSARRQVKGPTVVPVKRIDF